MRVLRTRYDMIAVLLQTAPKVHHNYAKRIITHNSFRRWERKSYEFRVMNLASPNVMRVLRTRYHMIAVLLQTAPKVHHNYAKRIITHNSFRRWEWKSYKFRVMNLASPNVMI